MYRHNSIKNSYFKKDIGKKNRVNFRAMRLFLSSLYISRSNKESTMKKRLVNSAVLVAFSCLAVGGFSSKAQAANINVATEISFLVDVSGSVDSNEFTLQRDGYVNAFRSIDFTGTSIAANFVYWSGANEQQEAVGWTLITDNTSANLFADLIAATTRPFFGSTAPGSAINFAVNRFANNSFDSTRQIIDVSGDGAENDGANTATARNNALAAGIAQINGLPILGEPGLLAFYQNNIQGGAGSFTIPAADFDTFSETITTKIERELVPSTPEPATVLGLLAVGGLGIALKRGKQK